MLSAKVVAVLALSTVFEVVQAAPHARTAEVAGKESAALLQTQGDPWLDTIHSIPHVGPHDGHKHRLEKIYEDATEDATTSGSKHAVQHQEKLEKQNVKLRRRVQALEAELGDEYNQKMSDQMGASVATSAEYEVVRVHSLGLISTLLMVGAIIIGGQLSSMVNSKDSAVKAAVWSTFERILIVFVVVCWFQVMDDFFHWLGVSLLTEVILSMLNAMLVFGVFIVLARKFMQARETQILVSILTAWGMHYLSFMLVHAGGHAMLFFSSHIGLAFLGVLLLFLVFSGVSALTRYVLLSKFKDNDESHFVDNIEELEDDASGMMLAFVFTLTIRFLICGHYESRFAEMDGDAVVARHNLSERLAMLGWAVFITVVAIIVIPRLNTIGEKAENTLGKYATQRLLLLLNPFLVMCIVWAVLLWADWEFYESLFRGEPILGRVVFAIVCSIACFGGILAFAKLSKRSMHPERMDPDRLKRQASKAMDLAWRWADLERRKFVLNAMSVLIAFSWGEAFNSSVDGAVASGAAPLWEKLLLTILVTMVVFPVYYYCVKDIVPAMQRLEDEELELHK